jgi:hypothetical protein
LEGVINSPLMTAVLTHICEEKIMKTGVIVYVLGEDDPGPAVDLEQEARRLENEADRVELVSRRAGHFDVSDAWWLLTAKGMNRILCSLAHLTDSGRLQLTGPVLRLAG